MLTAVCARTSIIDLCCVWYTEPFIQTFLFFCLIIEKHEVLGISEFYYLYFLCIVQSCFVHSLLVEGVLNVLHVLFIYLFL